MAWHSRRAEALRRILPSGPVPPNPAEILSLDRVREVIDVLSENAEVVLLDCPPVLPVTDALLLSRLVDWILVVASTNSASTKSASVRDLHRTFELLNQVQAPVLGTILNRVPVDGGYAYGYDGHYHDGATTDRGSKSGGRAGIPSGDRLASSSSEFEGAPAVGGEAASQSPFATRTAVSTGRSGPRENGSSRDPGHGPT